MNPVLNHPAVAKLRSSAPIREALQYLFDTAEFKLVVQAIYATTRPTGIPAPVAGLHPDTVTAHEAHRKMGVCQGMDAILAIATAPGTHDSEYSLKGTEFDHALPPELRERKK